MFKTTSLVQAFNEAKNETDANQMAAYMKHQFKFLGLKKPLRATLQKSWMQSMTQTQNIDWDLVETLYTYDEREYQYVAIDYLIKQKKYFQVKDLARLKQLVLKKSWWDSVDIIAAHLIGTLLQNTSHQSIMLEWAQDDDLWVRRCAILFQLRYKAQTNTQLLEEIIKYNLGSSEFFINKAIGWALREYSKTDEAWVREFVASHELAPLSYREALKYVNK